MSDYRNENDSIYDMTEDHLEIKACQALDESLRGYIVEKDAHRVTIKVDLDTPLSCDDYGMIYTGYLESIGQYCALLIPNDKKAVVIQSETEFLAPIGVGTEMTFKATELYPKHAKSRGSRSIMVKGFHKEMTVYESNMTIITLATHPFYKPDIINPF